METLLLWPEGAPGALGTSEEDQPAITPYLVEGKGMPLFWSVREAGMRCVPTMKAVRLRSG